jgi:GH24 family phage-related lysozyme (muramidase)
VVNKKIDFAKYCIDNHIHAKNLKERIIRFETINGKHSEMPYWDVSQWTWGYGTAVPKKLLFMKSTEQIKKLRITEPEAMDELEKHLIQAADYFFKIMGKNILQLNHVRREAFIDMMYNIGIGSFKKFINTIKELKKPIINFYLVADHVSDSRYYRVYDINNRVTNVIKEIASGKYRENFN